MPDRYFCADLRGSMAVLCDAEAHHAAHVMRIREGECVELFDGAGTTAVGKVVRIRRSDVALEISSPSFQQRPETGRLTLAVSPPKGDRLKWMIEKLTEIGVDRFIPLRCERSVVDPRQSKIDKLNSTVVGACKQSGRRWLMELGEAISFSELVNSTGGSDLYVAHPTVVSEPQLAKGFEADRIVAVGPEGGFSDGEIVLAKEAGAAFVSWPGNILRTETAAIVFAAVFNGSAQTDQDAAKD